MIIDRLLSVSTAQALTATAVSEDSIDLTTARDIGTGEPMALVFENLTAALTASGGAATLTIEAISADDAALTSNVVVHASSGAIAKAALVAGFRRILPIPPETNVGADRYWGARYTVATNNFDGGGPVDAYYAPLKFVQQLNQYPDALLMTGF
jgi:hypothetical protein